MIEHLPLYPQGKKAFQEWPLLGEINLENLHNLPTNTLGYCYAEHLIKNNLKPLNLKQVNNKYEFLGVHITETHDIWHVITNSNTDILGEIKLEAFYLAQLAYYRFWLALLSKNLLKSTVYNIEVCGDYLDAVSQGWTMGKQAKPLFGINWNDFWETPLEELRIDFNIDIPRNPISLRNQISE